MRPLKGLLLLTWTFASLAFGQSQPQDSYVPNEVLVKFKNTISNSVRSRIMNRNGTLKMKNLTNDGLSQVMVLSDQTVDEAIQSLQANPEVEFAQPNYIYRMTAVPNSPNYRNQWGLRNSANPVVLPPNANHTLDAATNTGMKGNDINIETAWNYITDCSPVIIAVIDTGINYTHENFQNPTSPISPVSSNLWNGGTAFPNHGYNFVEGNNDPKDKNGHGTHVAGIIGAAGTFTSATGAYGISGVCWFAQIMAVKVLDATGAGTTSSVTQGLNFAVAQGARIVNLSLGSSVYDAAFSNAISTAASKGVIIVTSAGNNGTDNDGGYPNYPCNYGFPNMLCVAALDQNYSLAPFSNFGSKNVHVGAPGVNIVSTYSGISSKLVPLPTPLPASGPAINDTLTSQLSQWTSNSGWGAAAFPLSNGNSYNFLINPANFNASTSTYANNADNRIYDTFTLPAGNQVATLSYLATYSLETAHDYFYTAFTTLTSDPFTFGTVLGSRTGTTGGAFESFTFDVSACAAAGQCTVGFRVQSDSSGVSTGVAITNLNITTMALNNTSYDVLKGTSMAAPFVTGLAAMIMAYNPNYSFLDVIHSILQGGKPVPALTSKTTSGKAIDALGALSYINAPTGLSATLQ